MIASLKIDGEITKDLTLLDAVRKMRGPKGTPVTVTIMREDFEAPKDFTITRDVIKIRSVTHRKLDDDLGYVRLRNFHKTTADELEEALRDLEEQKDHRPGARPPQQPWRPAQSSGRRRG